MKDTAKYPAIEAELLNGNEPLTDKSGETVAKLTDFWSWAHSALMGNTERGALSEYIVACALGVQDRPRINWDRYDLLTDEGISVEVKASGYLQAWAQEKLSAISFGIQPTFGWDSATNVTDSVRRRQADVYVFCVHNWKEQGSVNPLDLQQWEFWVLGTKTLDEMAKEQKTISLEALKKLGAVKCEFEEIRDAVLEMGGTRN